MGGSGILGNVLCATSTHECQKRLHAHRLFQPGALGHGSAVGSMQAIGCAKGGGRPHPTDVERASDNGAQEVHQSVRWLSSKEPDPWPVLLGSSEIPQGPLWLPPPDLGSRSAQLDSRGVGDGHLQHQLRGQDEEFGVLVWCLQQQREHVEAAVRGTPAVLDAELGGAKRTTVGKWPPRVSPAHPPFTGSAGSPEPFPTCKPYRETLRAKMAVLQRVLRKEVRVPPVFEPGWRWMEGPAPFPWSTFLAGVVT